MTLITSGDALGVLLSPLGTVTRITEIDFTTGFPLKLRKIWGDAVKQKELIAKLVKRSGLRRESVRILLKAFFEVVGEELAKGEPVRLRDFGAFLPMVWRHKRRWHTARKDILPSTPLVVPRFRPGQPLRDLVAQKLTAVQLPNGRFIIMPREPEKSEETKKR